MDSFKFKVNRVVPCNGTSIWMYSDGVKPKVDEIKLEITGKEWGDPFVYVWVKHNGPWEIYTDTGFERGISKIVSKKIGKPVKISFTEQGMQRTHKASMESASKASDKKLIRFLRNR